MSIFEKLEEIAENTAESVEGIEVGLKSDVARILLQKMEIEGVSQKNIAERVGMKESRISRILNLDSNLTLRTIIRLFKSFGERPRIVSMPLYPDKNITSVSPQYNYPRSTTNQPYEYFKNELVTGTQWTNLIGEATNG